jgi:hypothetical protein
MKCTLKTLDARLKTYSIKYLMKNKQIKRNRRTFLWDVAGYMTRTAITPTPSGLLLRKIVSHFPENKQKAYFGNIFLYQRTDKEYDRKQYDLKNVMKY